MSKPGIYISKSKKALLMKQKNSLKVTLYEIVILKKWHGVLYYILLAINVLSIFFLDW